MEAEAHQEQKLLEIRNTLQETMTFLGAIASGIEEAIGEPASDITHLAGKRLGKRFCEHAEKTDDIGRALDELRHVLEQNDCLWEFEAFHPSQRAALIELTSAGEEILLVFRDCMIRQSLFMFGHSQKGSLCNLMFGFFAGALETIMGRKSTLEIQHAGENACLKRLIIEPATDSPKRG